jgi:hypothetical protein
MSKRTSDRLAALEAAFAPQPDIWAELARKFFPVKLTVEMLDGHDAYVARCRAQHVAQGHAINADARPGYYCDTPEQWETYAMAQQAKLIADAAEDIARCEELAAERKREAEPPPMPARERKAKPTPTFVPAISLAFART